MLRYCFGVFSLEFSNIYIPIISRFCLLFKLFTSSSAIAERSRCTVGQFWPKVEDDILIDLFNIHVTNVHADN